MSRHLTGDADVHRLFPPKTEIKNKNLNRQFITISHKIVYAKLIFNIMSVWSKSTTWRDIIKKELPVNSTSRMSQLLEAF